MVLRSKLVFILMADPKTSYFQSKKLNSFATFKREVNGSVLSKTETDLLHLLFKEAFVNGL